MKADLYRRAFSRAVQIAGGRKRLAEYLRAEPQRLEQWLAGKGRPPVEVLQTVARLLKHRLLMPRKRLRR